MHPDATSRMSHEPSEPSTSTEPDMPVRPVVPRRRAVRISVSASQRYSTDGTLAAGSSCTATVTILLRSAVARTCRDDDRTCRRFAAYGSVRSQRPQSYARDIPSAPEHRQGSILPSVDIRDVDSPAAADYLSLPI